MTARLGYDFIKQMGVALPSRLVAGFGHSKIRAVGLNSSGVNEQGANRCDERKERLSTKRDRSTAV